MCLLTFLSQIIRPKKFGGCDCYAIFHVKGLSVPPGEGLAAGAVSEQSYCVATVLLITLIPRLLEYLAIKLFIIL